MRSRVPGSGYPQDGANDLPIWRVVITVLLIILLGASIPVSLWFTLGFFILICLCFAFWMLKDYIQAVKLDKTLKNLD